MERRRLAGMKPASLSHHRKIKKLPHKGTEERHGGKGNGMDGSGWH
jgi:hypothetical protein